MIRPKLRELLCYAVVMKCASRGLVLTILGTAALAHAQGEPAGTSDQTAPPGTAEQAAPAGTAPPMPTTVAVQSVPAASSGPSVSLTFSPIHLSLPLVEITAEYNVAPHAGIAVIGGVGKVTSGNVTASAYEAGGQFNYYLLRRFTGLHAGVEAMYMHLDNVNIDSSVTAGGLSIGPYLGYKVAASFGLTFIAQLGVDFLAAKASSTMSSQTASERTVFPLLNLNLGWSF